MSKTDHSIDYVSTCTQANDIQGFIDEYVQNVENFDYF